MEGSSFIQTARRHGLSKPGRHWVRVIARAMFGDRLGVVLFLASISFVALYWRVGVFITDTYAVGNALAAVADGHLEIRSLQYSLTFGSQPGLYVSDGAVYGRNYGHVFLALPVLWLLDSISWLFDLRLALAAGFSLLIFLLVDQLAHFFDSRRILPVAGSLTAIFVFFVNVLTATPIDPTWRPFMALQVTSMAAAAFVCVVLYRLLAHIHGRRSGAVIGLFAVVATPLGFWASIPKRHVISSLAVIVLLTTFYFARATDSTRRALVARSASYATVGLFTWLHGGEALILFAALVPLDIFTAPSNHPRDLVVVGLVFLVALLPFFLTNFAIAGNPLEPPRTLPRLTGQLDPGAGSPNGASGATGDAGSGVTAAQTETATSNPTATPESRPTATGTPATTALAAPARSGLIAPFLGVVAALVTAMGGLSAAAIDRALWAIGEIWSLFGGGIEVIVDEPERLYHTFVRSGRIPTGVNYMVNQQEAIELALLESVPLAGALFGAFATAGRKAFQNPSLSALASDLGRPERQTDLLAVTAAVLFVLTYITTLPLQTQITVRYLLPIVPLCLYGVGRLGAVYRTARANWRYLVGSYFTLLFVGGIAFLGAHVWLDLALGEAIQLHALVNLLGAVVLALWVVATTLGVRAGDRVDSLVLALPAALTTLFLLLTGFAYFRYAEYALPLARTIAELLPVGF